MNFKFYQDTNGSYFCEYSDGNQPADFLQTSCIDIDECDTQHVPMVCLLTLGRIWVMLTDHMTSLMSLVVSNNGCYCACQEPFGFCTNIGQTKGYR